MEIKLCPGVINKERLLLMAATSTINHVISEATKVKEVKTRLDHTTTLCASIDNPRFTSCRRIANFYNGACAEYVWQSHGARCTRSGSGHVPSDDDGSSNDKKPYVSRGKNPRTPGKRLGKNVGTSGSFIGSSHNPQLIEGDVEM
ncbi:hypothetical protein LZ31DRAFT_597413 [Colletotrichum somersetense]|nr:hypothetical protein LZ31DRAFT_597413 [Colletotrichum somersetense]